MPEIVQKRKIKDTTIRVVLTDEELDYFTEMRNKIAPHYTPSEFVIYIIDSIIEKEEKDGDK